MKNTIGLLVMVVMIQACGSKQAATISSAVSSKSIAVVTSTFSQKPDKAALLINNGGSYIASDLANGLGVLGDTSNQSKRMVFSYSIASLAGKSLKTGNLKLCYDTKSSTSLFTNFGYARAYRISGHQVPVGSDFLATEYGSVDILSSDAQINALAQHDCLNVDVKALIQASIDAGEIYVTIKIRFDNQTVSGVDAMNFYVDYTSVPLDAYIPTISGSF